MAVKCMHPSLRADRSRLSRPRQDFPQDVDLPVLNGLEGILADERRAFRVQPVVLNTCGCLQ